MLQLSEGLEKAQILKYAVHFRERVAEEDRVQNLEQPEKSNKVITPKYANWYTSSSSIWGPHVMDTYSFINLNIYITAPP
jgi:hypothetical protein